MREKYEILAVLIINMTIDQYVINFV